MLLQTKITFLSKRQNSCFENNFFCRNQLKSMIRNQGIQNSLDIASSRTKLNIVIKLTIVFLLVSTLQVSAKKISERVTINRDNIDLSEVFKSIRHQTNYLFFFDKHLLQNARPVDIKLKNATIDEVMFACLKNQPFTYSIVRNTIVIQTKKIVSLPNLDLAGFFSLSPPPVEIHGRVVDQEGKPLENVSVVIAGTQIGTTTNSDGRFTLNASDNKNIVLEVSSVGFQSRTINAGRQTEINVVLEAAVTGLSDVVVVGYGTQKKVNLTGAISTIKYDDELQNRPITNASQALSGKATGVWVSQNSGQPGNSEAQIRIRGWGTLNNSNPLVIIDGVEGAFDQINPNDIANISVLKDAASAAIYGSKAANGVILVTTKMGRKNEKMHVNLNSYIGSQSLARGFKFLTNSVEYMNLLNNALINVGSSPRFPDYVISAFEKGNDPYVYPNTDWNKAFFRNAIIQENNVSISGGSAQSSSFLSFNYLNQDGIIPNTSSKRYGIRANLESNVNNWLKVTGRLNYQRQVLEQPFEAGSPDVTHTIYIMDGSTPFIAPYTKDGRFGSVQAIDSNGVLLYDNRNALIDAANGSSKKELNSMIVNASAEIKFTPDLRLNTTVVSTGSWLLKDSYNQSVFGYTSTGVETITQNFNRNGLEMSRMNVATLDNNLYSTLNYHKTFAERHDISAIAGLQLENLTIKNTLARSAGPPQEGLTQVDAGSSGVQAQGNMVGLKTLSYFGRLNYAFSNKYLLEADLRADASSRFKEGNRWGIFPGFSAGWRLSEEKFIQKLNLFSNLKFRASWGQLGNQNISGYWPYLTVVDQNFGLSYSYNNTFVPGAAVTSLIDQNITWETSTTLDFGLDMGFLDDKLNIEADYFNKKTSGIIVQLPIPLILGGVTPPYENVGQMENKGFELTVNFDNRKYSRNQLGYNIGINGTYIKNEVTKFKGGKSPDQLFLIREGYSYQSLYGYKAIGIFQTNDEAAQYMANNSYQPKQGNLKFEDVNNDGKLDFQDKQYLGNTIPKYTFGLSSGFRFKGFDLNILLQGIAGVHAYTANAITTISSDMPSITKKWKNGWTPENTNTTIPSIKIDNSWDNSQSSFWVHNTSFLKLRNIQLGYELLPRISSHLGLQNIYLYFNAQNVFTIVDKNFEGYDPEKNTFSSSTWVYPNPRILSFGINIKF